MKYTYCLLSIAFISVLFSCKKEESASQNTVPIPDTTSTDSLSQMQLDTIFPGSYLPAWPGSWWQYVDSNNVNSTINTSATFVKDCYHFIFAPNGTGLTDTVYVPLYNNIPLYEYSERTGYISNSSTNSLHPLLFENMAVGYSWINHYWAATRTERMIISVDTTMVVNGVSYYPVIGVKEYYTLGPPPPPPTSQIRYYAKNVGMILEENYDILNGNLESKRWLVNYNINH